MPSSRLERLDGACTELQSQKDTSPFPGLIDVLSPSHIAKYGGSSNVRYPYGNPVVPRVPRRPLFRDEIHGVYAREVKTPENKAVSSKHLHTDAIMQISPRVVTFQAGVTEVIPAVWPKPKQLQSPRKFHIIHIPRHHLPSSAGSTYTQRPFSEEASTNIVTPEQGQHPQESHTTTVSTIPQNEPHPLKCHSPSVSPDYMLVGAHFSGDKLLILSNEGQVIHQLTDTESDANLAYSETSMIHNFDVPLLTCAETPPTGSRAPPPTAAANVQRRVVAPDIKQAEQLHEDEETTDQYTSDEPELNQGDISTTLDALASDEQPAADQDDLNNVTISKSHSTQQDISHSGDATGIQIGNESSQNHEMTTGEEGEENAVVTVSSGGDDEAAGNRGVRGVAIVRRLSPIEENEPLTDENAGTDINVDC